MLELDIIIIIIGFKKRGKLLELKNPKKYWKQKIFVKHTEKIWYLIR